MRFARWKTRCLNGWCVWLYQAVFEIVCHWFLGCVRNCGISAFGFGAPQKISELGRAQKKYHSQENRVLRATLQHSSEIHMHSWKKWFQSFVTLKSVWNIQGYEGIDSETSMHMIVNSFVFGYVTRPVQKTAKIEKIICAVWICGVPTYDTVERIITKLTFSVKWLQTTIIRSCILFSMPVLRFRKIRKPYADTGIASWRTSSNSSPTPTSNMFKHYIVQRRYLCL